MEIEVNEENNVLECEEEQNNNVANFLRNDVKKDIKIDFKSPKHSEKVEELIDTANRDIIKNANNKFLIDTLSPEISANEQKKRRHKDILLITVGIFISIQFILLFVITYKVLDSMILAHTSGMPYSDETMKIMFAFLGAYMTSIVVELIAMLHYIVTNVFDASIIELVDHFKDNVSND